MAKRALNASDCTADANLNSQSDEEMHSKDEIDESIET